jgi:hypothetical protein
MNGGSAGVSPAALRQAHGGERSRSVARHPACASVQLCLLVCFTHEVEFPQVERDAPARAGEIPRPRRDGAPALHQPPQCLSLGSCLLPNQSARVHRDDAGEAGEV